MTNYLKMIKELKDCGYTVFKYDGVFYWETYSRNSNPFLSEEDAWNNAYTDCNEVLND